MLDKYVDEKKRKNMNFIDYYSYSKEKHSGRMRKVILKSVIKHNDVEIHHDI